MKTDVLVLGAGLSGLRVTQQLVKQHRQTMLLDARTRLGGRILSLSPKDASLIAGLDMGPSWFWPWQHRMIALVKELDLNKAVYEQHSNGESVAEYRTGQLVKQAGIASMTGSLRLSGGLYALINALSDSIDSDSIHTNSRLTHASLNEDGIETTIDQQGKLITIQANQLVMAAPPRVVAKAVQFQPELDAPELTLMHQTPTWMAGQAKFMATYNKPFWREQGLSGDGVSEIGPLGEIHDASAAAGAPYALFGFVGVSAQARANKAEDIKSSAVQQLTRMFGAQARTPIEVFYKDWADDEFTATDADRNGPPAHAHQSINTEPLWNNRLFWAGSETASVSSGDNGYLEGALAAAERVVQQIRNNSEA